jgi:hypothetical protein
MIKHEERTHPQSCWNKADEDELLFVILERDAAAPIAIRAWVEARIKLGKNQRSDQQIVEALGCAARMSMKKK